MTRMVWMAIVLLAIGVSVSAQEPATLRAETFAIGGEPTLAPPGWTTQATDPATTPSPAFVTAYGPGVRITTAVATTLYRPAAPLKGDGTVGALVFVDSATPGIFGITLGGQNGVAFLVKPSGAAVITPLRNGHVTNAGWTLAPAVSIPAVGMLQPCRIEVRVEGTRAELFVNGTVAAATTIAAGALNGVPGVYSGPGALAVVGLMLRAGTTSTGVAK